MFDPELFFTQATRLARNANGEEDYRSAISRAYYSCHIIARDQLFGVDGRKQTAKERKYPHQIIVSTIRETNGIPSRQSLASKLNLLMTMRVHADYVRRSSKVDGLFKRHRVTDWDKLAQKALTIAIDIKPVLKGLKPLR